MTNRIAHVRGKLELTSFHDTMHNNDPSREAWLMATLSAIAADGFTH
jgi:hypothetical protein